MWRPRDDAGRVRDSRTERRDRVDDIRIGNMRPHRTPRRRSRRVVKVEAGDPARSGRCVQESDLAHSFVLIRGVLLQHLHGHRRRRQSWRRCRSRWRHRSGRRWKLLLDVACFLRILLGDVVDKTEHHGLDSGLSSSHSIGSSLFLARRLFLLFNHLVPLCDLRLQACDLDIRRRLGRLQTLVLQLMLGRVFFCVSRPFCLHTQSSTCNGFVAHESVCICLHLRMFGEQTLKESGRTRGMRRCCVHRLSLTKLLLLHVTLLLFLFFHCFAARQFHQLSAVRAQMRLGYQPARHAHTAVCPARQRGKHFILIGVIEADRFHFFFVFSSLKKSMGKYTCRDCGSTSVYHRCCPRVVAQQTTAVVLAVPVQQLSYSHQANAPTPPPPASMAPQLNDKTSNHQVCDVVNCTNAVDRARRGLRWNNAQNKTTWVRGDNLCAACFAELRDLLAEYIPVPPGKPGGYLIAQARKTKRVPKDRAISLLWCHGRLIEARRVLERGHASVCVSDL